MFVKIFDVDVHVITHLLQCSTPEGTDPFHILHCKLMGRQWFQYLLENSQGLVFLELRPYLSQNSHLGLVLPSLFHNHLVHPVEWTKIILAELKKKSTSGQKICPAHAAIHVFQYNNVLRVKGM